MAGRLMLVGRDWGFWEQREGRPFVGPAGNLLNRALKSAGIDRERECVVTNICNKKPRNDEWRLHQPNDIEEGVKTLLALARREQPALLIAFGAHSAYTLRTGEAPPLDDRAFPTLFAKEFGAALTEVRGYIFESSVGAPLLVTVHPAYVLRAWFPWWPLFCYDMKKARRVYDEAVRGGWMGGVSRARVGYHEELLTEPPTNATAWTSAPCMAVDSEHNGREIACLGWSVTPDCGFAAPWREDFFPFFRELLESQTSKVLQNGASDEYMFNRHGFALHNYAHELMYQWHTLEPLLAGKVVIGDDASSSYGRSHKSLAFFASLLTDESWWKNYQFEQEEERLRLCARDSRITLECHLELEKRLSVAR